MPYIDCCVCHTPDVQKAIGQQYLKVGVDADGGPLFDDEVPREAKYCAFRGGGPKYQYMCYGCWRALAAAWVPEMNETAKLRKALSEVIVGHTIDEWLKMPNEAFGAVTPLELIARGEISRIWDMVYRLRSGLPG